MRKIPYQLPLALASDTASVICNQNIQEQGISLDRTAVQPANDLREWSIDGGLGIHPKCQSG